MGKKGRLIPCENLGEEYKKVEFLKTDLIRLNKWLVKTVLKKRKFGVKRDTSCSKKVGETTTTPTLQRSPVSRKKKQLAAVKFFFIVSLTDAKVILNPRCMMIKDIKTDVVAPSISILGIFFSKFYGKLCFISWLLFILRFLLENLNFGFFSKWLCIQWTLFGKKIWLLCMLFSLSYLDLIF